MSKCMMCLTVLCILSKKRKKQLIKKGQRETFTFIPGFISEKLAAFTNESDFSLKTQEGMKQQGCTLLSRSQFLVVFFFVFPGNLRLWWLSWRKTFSFVKKNQAYYFFLTITNYFTIIPEMFILVAVLSKLKLIVQKPPWESETQHITLLKNMRPILRKQN